MFGMQRANGDWFALKHRGGLRVPVFASDSEAMLARTFNVEMLVFKPVILDERALKDFEPMVTSPLAHFWLVEKASRSMKRGVAFDHAQLLLLIRANVNQPSPDNGAE